MQIKFSIMLSMDPSAVAQLQIAYTYCSWHKHVATQLKIRQASKNGHSGHYPYLILHNKWTWFIPGLDFSITYVYYVLRMYNLLQQLLWLNTTVKF